MSVTRAEQFAAYFRKLANQASHVVRDVDPEDRLTHFRLRANKHEILVSEGSDYMVARFAASARGTAPISPARTPRSRSRRPWRAPRG